MGKRTSVATASPAPPVMRICEECKKEFVPTARNNSKNVQRFCDKNCRWIAWDKRNPRTYIKP